MQAAPRGSPAGARSTLELKDGASLEAGLVVLCSGAGVLDVAAGSGALSAELCARASAALRCTLVEPAVRDAPRSPPGCRFLVECFDDADFAARHEALLRDCSILVGCHPDQCTESSVDVALARGKPFAVIPCCVFPTLFPARRIGTGQSVRTYRGFLKYLREKHPGVLTARLGFEGRNRVLFYRGGAPEGSEADPSLPDSAGAAVRQ